ncbi:uncharacterized protein BN773_00858 [Prevotella sp. CAG:755]|nr:uncharacterized protein BN773_00858 [Prevotella sp. CAG:755]
MAVFQFLNQFVLVGLSTVSEKFQSICFRDVAAHKGLLTLLELGHLLFDGLEVAFLDDNALGGHHVVIETAFNGRSDAELNAGIEFLQGFRHEVGRSVPKGMLAFLVVPLVKLDGRVVRDGTVQFHGFTVDAARQDILCQAWRNAFCNLQASHAAFVFTDRTVRKGDLYHNGYFLFVGQR